jgi:SAM-dependent methyltransferase
MREALRDFIKRTPFLGDLVGYRRAGPFSGSRSYWERRYATGGDSGLGSYGILAQFKADVINTLVARHRIRSVIEFGCGDGNQLTLAKYPQYLGFDVSGSAVLRCRELFKDDPSKSFRLTSAYCGEKADLALSLDVIFHLVENNVFENHMHTVFGAANRYVVIYSSDFEDPERQEGPHVRHRKFTRWVRRNLPDWILVEHIPNRHPYSGDAHTGSFCEFYVYEKA